MSRIEALKIGKQQADKWYRENKEQIKATQSIERKKANLPQTD